ncbi:hypothetical protein D3C73_1322400 [compost metagenome]
MPTITGATGKSKRRINTPPQPIANISSRSKDEWRMPYTPMVANTRMPAFRYGRGICSSLTHSPTSGRFSTSRMTLPMYSEATSVQTRSAEVSNSIGPGCRL